MQTTTRLDANLAILSELSLLMNSGGIEVAVAAGPRLRIGAQPTRYFWRGRLLPSQATAILFLLDIRETEARLSSGFLVMESLSQISFDRQKTLTYILKDFAATTARTENDRERGAWFDNAADWDLS